MARVSSTKSWSWHQRLSHLNFDTINDLARNDLVAGLSKFKYHKEHLCPSCEQGKSKRASHPPKPVPNSRQRLHLLHMDLCGPMRIASINGKRYILVIVDDYSCYTWVHFLRSKDEAPAVIITFLKRNTVLLHKRASHPPKPVPNSKQRLHLLHMDLCGLMRVASINGKRYVLVIVDDYSRYTWVYFLRTKDETLEVIKNFLKKIYVRLQAPVIIVRTDNGTEFKTQVLNEYFDSVGITHETSTAKTPQQNGVVERRNRTLVEAARTMTRKIMEMMNVTFDELSAMAFEQNSSRPGLQSMTSGQISSEIELTYAPSTITPQRPSERDMDILFEPLHNEYLGGRLAEALRAIPAAPMEQNLQAPTASMSVQDSAPVPTNSSNT
nr:putative ribonuclease H-like domain-containing protein [Tanacetum cinerariifolium]